MLACACVYVYYVHNNCVINIVYSNIIYCWSADTICRGGESGPQHPQEVASAGRIVSDQRPGNAGSSDKERFSHVDDSELSRLLK